MTAELVSPSTFKWVLTFLTLGGSMWALIDIFKIARLVRTKADTRDPLVRDQYFGYVIGIFIGLLGIAGILRYHGVI